MSALSPKLKPITLSDIQVERIETFIKFIDKLLNYTWRNVCYPYHFLTRTGTYTRNSFTMWYLLVIAHKTHHILFNIATILQ